MVECREDVDIEFNRTSSLSRQRGLSMNKRSIELTRPYKRFPRVAGNTGAVKFFAIYAVPEGTEENTQQAECMTGYFISLASSSSCCREKSISNCNTGGSRIGRLPLRDATCVDPCA